jgi:hypothetical protein
MAAMGAGVEAAEGRHRGRLWVDSGRSIAVPRMAGFGALQPIGSGRWFGPELPLSGHYPTAAPTAQLGGYPPLAPGASSVRHPTRQRTFKYVAMGSFSERGVWIEFFRLQLGVKWTSKDERARRLFVVLSGDGLAAGETVKRLSALQVEPGETLDPDGDCGYNVVPDWPSVDREAAERIRGVRFGGIAREHDRNGCLDFGMLGRAHREDWRSFLAVDPIWRSLRASMQNLSRQRVIITCGGGTRLKT